MCIYSFQLNLMSCLKLLTLLHFIYWEINKLRYDAVDLHALNSWGLDSQLNLAILAYGIETKK